MQLQRQPQMQQDDNRILILFDLNGVLTDHTPARHEGRYVVSKQQIAGSCLLCKAVLSTCTKAHAVA
jgi:hypothetical protein